MIICPFNPLFFVRRSGRMPQQRIFAQIFAATDDIYIQVFRGPDEPSVTGTVIDAGTLATVLAIQWSVKPLTSEMVLQHHTITGLPAGCYRLKLNDEVSEPFVITSDESELKDTVLIKYSPASNRVRSDVLPIIDNQRKFFSIRMPGGFKDNGYSFSVDNEQFVTQYSDIVELYSRDSTQVRLTVGYSDGVPIWFGQMLNRLLTCKYVFIDGVRFARFESSVPEKEQVLDNSDRFVFSQTLQEILYLQPKIEDVQ